MEAPGHMISDMANNKLCKYDAGHHFGTKDDTNGQVYAHMAHQRTCMMLETGVNTYP